MGKATKCIYQATNTINGKIYIGQTNDLQRRIREHRAHAIKDGGEFHEDIRKYGFDCFQFHILEECRSSDADARERFYIAKVRKEYGEMMVYNYCDGGPGGQTHDISGANNPSYGRTYSDEERAELSRKLKGRKKPEEFGRKISAALKGKPKPRSAVLKRSHPVSVIHVETGEVLRFDSKAAMTRAIHSDIYTLKAGKVSKSGYKLYCG